MDTVFRDDECRVRTEHAFANFTTIKHIACNLIRKPPGKESPQGARPGSFGSPADSGVHFVLSVLGEVFEALDRFSS